MTDTDRDLVEAIRAELAAIDPIRACCRRAEAAGLAGVAAGSRAGLARLALRLRPGRDAARRGSEPASEHGSPVAGASLPAAVDERGRAEEFDWDAAPEHCREAYLRGLFLARGSLSLSGGRSHLEFIVAPAQAPVLAARLASLDLPASWRIRRGRGVVTWKSSEKVSLFLRHVGAAGQLLELEARQVSRAVRGDLNRVINAESANLQRGVLAAARQLEAIDAVESDGRLAEQPYVVRLVADARRETPEATLTELAERLQVHRSSVQRALERVEWLALHPDDERPRRRRRGAEESLAGR